jgi:hypothetical protein
MGIQHYFEISTTVIENGLNQERITDFQITDRRYRFYSIGISELSSTPPNVIGVAGRSLFWSKNYYLPMSNIMESGTLACLIGIGINMRYIELGSNLPNLTSGATPVHFDYRMGSFPENTTKLLESFMIYNSRLVLIPKSAVEGVTVLQFAFDAISNKYAFRDLQRAYASHLTTSDFIPVNIRIINQDEDGIIWSDGMTVMPIGRLEFLFELNPTGNSEQITCLNSNAYTEPTRIPWGC